MRYEIRKTTWKYEGPFDFFCACYFLTWLVNLLFEDLDDGHLFYVHFVVASIIKVSFQNLSDTKRLKTGSDVGRDKGQNVVETPTWHQIIIPRFSSFSGRVLSRKLST